MASPPYGSNRRITRQLVLTALLAVFMVEVNLGIIGGLPAVACSAG